MGRFWRDLQTIPNIISLFRIVLIFMAAVLYLKGYRLSGFVIGAFAGVSDIVDGWIARKLHQTTAFGAILDRLSDLIMETVAFAVLLYYHLLPAFLFILYLAREYIVITARQYVAEQGQTIPSTFFGKRKTNLVMGSFGALFMTHVGVVEPDQAELFYKIGYAMMVGGLVCSYISGVQYLRTFVGIYNTSTD
jgi:CDP-diacylglycerol--glycerol-3-phosphate 3-phosphatidyltransferase